MAASCPVVKFHLREAAARYYRVEAEANGEKIGEVKAQHVGKTMTIIWSHVDPKYRHCGLGTRMYARLAKQACVLGARLQSDTARSKYAEAFWAKQHKKGRATCDPGTGDLYDPTEGYVDNFWSCLSYTLTCPVTSLKGGRR